MRSELADRLLAKVLNWDSSHDSTKYRLEIEILSKIKYDEYQQYFPGLRFTESLATWLNQMESSDRKIMFDFIRNQLLFISTKEMNLLVSQAFPDYIRPILYQVTAQILNCSKHRVSFIDNSPEYKALLRRTLFLGLSDGARTDVIRRFNPFISHEQVLPFYLIPESKYDDLQSEMISDLSGVIKEEHELCLNKFSTLVLLDDFTASGTSYFKYDDVKNKFKGKVSNILAEIRRPNKLGKLFETENLKIIIVIYISTTHAKKIINNAIQKWLKLNSKSGFEIQFVPVYELPDSVNIKIDNKKICDILKKYYDPSIVTGSYKKGKWDHPYLGFDECGLPLILNHNTPNNSLPLLWNEQHADQKSNSIVGLFPRVSRHKK